MARIIRLEITDYKSIGHIVFENIGDFNILVGKNNSGKSNILDAIQTLLYGLDQPLSHKSKLNQQLHRNINGRASHSFKIEITVELRSTDILPFLAQSGHFTEIISKIKQGTHIVNIVREHIYHNAPLNYGVWLTPNLIFDSLTLIQNSEGQYIFENEAGVPIVTKQSDGILHDGITLDFATAIFKALKFRCLRVDFATEIKHESSVETYDGLRKPLVPIQVIERMKTWQKDLDDTSKTELQKIYTMLTLDHNISEWAEVIRITDSGYNPPLEAIGSGVQHLLTLAYNLYLRPSILLIEEPEQHLHPKIVRHVSAALSNYCKENQIQIFIASHSTSFLNPASSKDIWITSKTDSGTTCQKVGTDKGFTDVINELGVRISDICLSDSMLFVEGPSDRIIMEKWFEIMEYPLEWPSVYVVEMGGKDERKHQAATWKPVCDAFPTIKMAWLFDADLSKAEKEVFQNILISDKVWRLENGDIEDYFPLGIVKKALFSLLALNSSQKERIGKINRNKSIVQQVDDIVGKGTWKVKLAQFYADRCVTIPKKIQPIMKEIKDFLFESP